VDRRYIYAFLGSFSLTILYIGITSLGGGVELFKAEFRELWYFLLPLIGGFGLQIWLFSHIRLYGKGEGKKEVATTGCVSTGSMIACCAHHVTDILPFVGLTAAAVVLADYQRPLLLIGNLSNVIGAIWMLDIIQKFHLYSEESRFKALERIHFGALKWHIILSAIAIFIVYLIIYNPSKINVEEMLKLASS
jgi:hypothetical protein